MKFVVKSIVSSLAAALLISGSALVDLSPSLFAKDGNGSGGGGEVRLRCNSSVRRGPEMGAEWRSIDGGARTRFSVEVADLANTSGLTANVNGGESWDIPEAIAPTPGAANGVADLNLDTRDGDVVPALSSGDQVNVLQNGVGLLSCFLR